MQLVHRILLALAGVVSILTALRLWFAMGAMLTQFGIAPLNLVGRQTVRADMGGLFLGIGVFAVMAAWKRSAAWAFGGMVLTLGAIAGRFAGVLTDGAGPGVWPPIIVEAVIIALFAQAWRNWKTA
jgi:hypothetical protein